MNLVKRNNSLTFPSLLDEILRTDWNGGTQNLNNSFPAVNIKENETGFKMEFYAPGLSKEEIKLEIDQNTLSISSEKKSENEVNNERYSRKEYSFTSFKRTFDLPESVNSDGIQANYENGILNVVLPKKEEALPKPKRMIEIA